MACQACIGHVHQSRYALQINLDVRFNCMTKHIALCFIGLIKMLISQWIFARLLKICNIEHADLISAPRTVINMTIVGKCKKNPRGKITVMSSIPYWESASVGYTSIYVLELYKHDLYHPELSDGITILTVCVMGTFSMQWWRGNSTVL